MKYGKPQFELTRVYDDGSKDPPEIVPVIEMPWDTKMSRRGALGAGLTATAVLLLLGACDDKYNIFSTKTAKEVDIQDSPDSQRKAPDGALQAHKQAVVKLLFSPDSASLVSSASDNTAKQWSVPEGQLLTTITEKTLKPLHLGITPDGKTLVGDLGSGIGLWSLPKGNLVKKFSGAEASYAGKFALAPEGNLYAVVRNKGIELYSVPQGELLATLPGYENKAVPLMSFAPNGKMLVTGTTGEEVKLWSVPDGKQLGVLKTSNFFDNGNIQFFVNPESTVAAMITGGQLGLWSLPEGQKLPVKYNSDSMNSMAITPDGKILIVIGKTFKIPNSPAVPPGSPGPAAAPSFPNSPAASVDTTIISLWSFPEMEPLTVGRVRSPGYIDANLSKMAVTPDGKMLAVAFYNGMDVWMVSLPDLKLESVLKGNKKVIQSLAVSPDGKLLATGDYGGAIMLWDLEKKEFLSYLFDKNANQSSVKGIAYNVKDKVTGRTITYTLPCGSPIPPGAVCTCNCVPGTYTSPPPPPRPKPRRPSGSFGGGTYCTCNKICTCIPVPSDRDAKESFETTDPMLILQRLAELPIQKWNYKWDSTDVRHIGPMAQDFAAAFAVGEDDRHISPVDAQGVAFAAIQGLYQLIKEKDKETQNLMAQLQKQREENQELKSRIESLEKLLK